MDSYVGKRWEDHQLCTCHFLTLLIMLPPLGSTKTPDWLYISNCTNLNPPCKTINSTSKKKKNLTRPLRLDLSPFMTSCYMENGLWTQVQVSDFSICAGYSSGFQNILHYVEVYVHILAISLSMWGEGYIAMVNKVTHMHLFISFYSFLSHPLANLLDVWHICFWFLYTYMSLWLFSWFFLFFYFFLYRDRPWWP